MKKLTPRQREEVICKLISLQMTLSASIVEMSKRFLNNCSDRTNNSAYSNHPADATHGISIEEYKASRTIGKLRQIDAVLKRIDSDEFGICIDCEETIPFKRLCAVLTTLRCVSCEERKENETAEKNGRRRGYYMAERAYSL